MTITVMPVTTITMMNDDDDDDDDDHKWWWRRQWMMMTMTTTMMMMNDDDDDKNHGDHHDADSKTAPWCRRLNLSWRRGQYIDHHDSSLPPSFLPSLTHWPELYCHFSGTQAVLAAYGRKRLQRQNTADDPRLVDMDDCNGNSAKEGRPANNHGTKRRSLHTERPGTPQRALRAPPLQMIKPQPRRLEPIRPRRPQSEGAWGEPSLDSSSESSVDDDETGNDEISSVLRETYADCVASIQQAFDRKMVRVTWLDALADPGGLVGRQTCVSTECWWG